MKNLIATVLFFSAQISLADACDSFVGYWDLQCKSEVKSVEIKFEISKIGACEGLHFLGEDLYFGKVRAETIETEGKIKTTHSLLNWGVGTGASTTLEIFKGIFVTRSFSEPSPSVQTDSWKNHFSIDALAADGPHAAIYDQVNFGPTEMFDCKASVRKP